MQEATTEGASNVAQSPEVIVGQIRQYMRVAEEKIAAGDESGAALEERHADRLLVQLVNSCRYTMQRHAETFFPGMDREAAREDAVVQMTINAVDAIKDTSPKNELYERRFNLCFKRDCIDAARSVLRENDYPIDSENGPAITLISADDAIGLQGEDAGGATVGELIADPMASEAFDNLVDSEALLHEISLLSSRHRQIVEMWLESRTWSQIALACGISEKTASKYLVAAAAIVLSKLNPEQENRK